MPRPRKPIEMQKGNLTVITGQKRRTEEESVTTDKNQLKRPPKWLVDDIARKEWRRIVKELSQINLVGNLDLNNLGGYCNAFANYVKATEILKDQTYYIDRETRNGIIVVKNPMVDIQKGFAEEMRKFAGLCGMTIDSRLKVAAVKTESKEDNIKRQFGNI
ncbi:MAG: phage terminase small subunit P27 family [Clostridiales bacterium]|nr:phage terminase small subunit P27 family [Clostridiales bacterium]